MAADGGGSEAGGGLSENGQASKDHGDPFTSYDSARAACAKSSSFSKRVLLMKAEAFWSARRASAVGGIKPSNGSHDWRESEPWRPNGGEATCRRGKRGGQQGGCELGEKEGGEGWASGARDQGTYQRIYERARET